MGTARLCLGFKKNVHLVVARPSIWRRKLLATPSRCRSTTVVGTLSGRRIEDVFDGRPQEHQHVSPEDCARMPVLDFTDFKQAFKSKSSLEILRALTVFKTCSIDFLVEKNREVRKLKIGILNNLFRECPFMRSRGWVIFWKNISFQGPQSKNLVTPNFLFN